MKDHAQERGRLINEQYFYTYRRKDPIITN